MDQWASSLQWGESPFLDLDTKLDLADTPEDSPGTTDSSSEDPSGSNQSEEDDEAGEEDPPHLSPRINSIPTNFPAASMNERISEILVCATCNLKESKNFLVECPVKSERRLAILCGTIAYWQWAQGESSTNMPSTSSADYSVPTKKARRTQKIYYGINNFEEVHHVIQELVKLEASGHLKGLKMAVLGDKKSFGCVTNQHCVCHNIIMNDYTPRSQFRFIERSPFGLDLVRDVGDFKTDCHQLNYCPYLESQYMHENADLVICPQDFILSPVLRRDYKIDLWNAILIFDDGFNMEKVCDSEASISLPTQELDQLVQKLRGLATSLPMQPNVQSFRPTDSVELLQNVQQSAQNLASSLGSLSSWIRGRAEMPPTKEDILEALQQQGLAMEEQEYDELYIKLQTLLTHSLNPDSAALYKIRKFLAVLKIIYADNKSNLQYYHLKKAKCDAINPNNNEDTDLALIMTCINPGLIFKPASASTQSVIVAANCLAPKCVFEKDLGVTFDETLEIKSHEAPSDRYVLSYCAVGPNPQQVRLNLDYESRSDPEVQDAVGKSLLEICKVMPNGVVAVFHTEHMLYPLQKRWKERPNHLSSSIMERFHETKGGVFCEMDVGDDQGANEMFENYRALSRRGNGALLLALARGRLWEKIQTLKGEEIRAIVHVSVPYAAWDIEDLIVAKRRIICDSKIPEAKHRNLEWYNTEAYRILNQSFALCVQDQRDWGAMIVLDSRIIGKKNQFDELIPAWARKEFKQRNFTEMIRKLESLVSSCSGIEDSL